MAFQIIVTNAGRAALVNAQANGTRGVTIAACGISNTALAPDPTLTALPNELKRLSGTDVSGVPAAAAVLHLVVRDESADAYSMKSFGLYLDDGTLFAVYGQNSDIFSKVASSLMLLAVDIDFADINATSIAFGDTNFLNPPATTSMAGVVELADDGEAAAITDAQRALTPRGFSLALTKALILLRLGFTPANKAGDLFTGSVNTQGDFNAAHAGTTNLTLEALGSVRARLAAQSDGNVVLYRFAGTENPIFSSDGNFFNSYLPIMRQGATVWDAGNDGAGSGLDADLLDGRDSSAYALVATTVTFQDVIAGRGANSGTVFLGTNLQHFLYFDGANYQMPGGNLILNGGKTWHSGNDGAGSGLDADLLDGRDSSAYALVNTTVAFQDVIAGKGANSGTLFLGTNLQHFLYFDGANYQMPGGNLILNGGTTWHSNNDGAGSGLDADMLDGHHASEFAQLSGATFTGTVQAEGALYLHNASTGARPYFAMQGDNNFVFYRTDGFAIFSYLMDGGADRAFTFNVPLTIQGNIAWHAGNDGAGSGLDADMLDGHHASDFAQLGGASFSGGVSAPRLQAGASGLGVDGNADVGGSLRRAGNTVWDAANDGAGSGLDADMLDGHHASDFAQLGGAGFSGGVSAPRLQAGSSGLGVDGNADVGGYLHRGGNNVWDAGNDGAGSGLDADMLDGRHASDFALLSSFGSNLNGVGHQVLPSGMIMQWGEAAHSDDSGAQQVNFDTAFPNSCFQVIVSNEAGGIPVAFHGAGNLTRSGCTVYSASTSGGPGLKGTAFRYIAIGN